ncbi:MAG: glycosyltransferase family 2 protein [Lachnospiraceae bacterium]|nr:glycosyltransferase family 2 protein [Lachnospiraceae bacterium]
MQTDLSVIIPHYNIPDLLLKLLESIPDRDNVEVIVVNDASTCSLADVEKYISERTNIRLIKETVNGGAGTCRNDGLSDANGRWVMFADADDHFINGWYETVSAYFTGDADLVYFMAESEEIGSGQESVRHVLINDTLQKLLDDPKDVKAALDVRYKINVPWCKLISMKLIRDHKIAFDRVKVSNDEMFSAKTGYCARKIAIEKTPVYCVTSRPGSLEKVVSKENFWIRLLVFIRKYHFLEEHLSKEDFALLDLSAQEKIFSLFQNRYDLPYCRKVLAKLRSENVRFLTAQTFRPRALIAKCKLALSLLSVRKKEKKYISKE